MYANKAVIDKYASFNSRVRQLNIPERNFIDEFNLNNKRVLILGSGAGRVPANLILFGNEVHAVEKSNRLYKTSLKLYPPKQFKKLTFYQGDAKKLDFIPDGSFDLVFFPMNGIDLAESINDRERILIEMSKKCRENGLLAFTSHVSTAYIFSPKVRIKEQRFNFFSDFRYSQEPVVGGGGIIQRQN